MDIVKFKREQEQHRLHLQRIRDTTAVLEYEHVFNILPFDDLLPYLTVLQLQSLWGYNTWPFDLKSNN